MSETGCVVRLVSPSPPTVARQTDRSETLIHVSKNVVDRRLRIEIDERTIAMAPTEKLSALVEALVEIARTEAPAWEHYADLHVYPHVAQALLAGRDIEPGEAVYLNDRGGAV